MTTVLNSVPANTAPLPDLKVTQARVLRSEWTKFRSLRSTVWTLVVAVILMVGIGALFAGVTEANYSSFDEHAKASFNAVTTSLNGILFAQLAIGVLGVLMITGEYSTGMIRSSMTAVPRRLPVLWGKLTVFAGMVLVVSLVTSFVSFFVGQALLSIDNLGVSITSSGALSAVIGSALYMTIAGMIALAVGALFRNTAAAISTFVGVFFVIPPLAQLLPSSISDHVTQYLPSNAGAAMYGGADSITNALSAPTGFAVLCAYAAILIAAAAWRLRRTDA